MTRSSGLLADLMAHCSGESMFELVRELYPICRSITGDGVRETLQGIRKRLPIEVREVPTGTPVFDWTIPKEWNVNEAWIKGPGGEKVVDFSDHNLHLVGYSVPVHKTMTLESLRSHLHSLPEYPDWIPYRTSYYNETWGFCLPHNRLRNLTDGDYEVFVDTSLSDGAMSYGEYLIEGSTDEEFLLSAHICHPSLANDNLSGISLLTQLGQCLEQLKTRYSYRLIFAPGTIGSIAWLARNRDKVEKIRHGLVVSCVGDAGGPNYKKSRQGNARIDRAVCRALQEMQLAGSVEEFSPYGYDERQYCSPAFDLPVGLLERSKYGAFPEYHTSADNLNFVSPEHLESSYEIIARVIGILESDRLLVSTNQQCEPQLGKRGLYKAIGGDSNQAERQLAMLWVLNLADGDHSLYDMAERSGIEFGIICETADLLEKHKLLRVVSI